MGIITDGLEEFPWPSKGDTLFKDAPNVRQVAALDGLSKSIGAYTIGYRDAAKLIVDNLSSYQAYPDLILYPLAYLYGHATELSFKHLIRLEALKSKDNVEWLNTTHNLPRLWDKARDIIERHSNDTGLEFLDPCEGIINELTKFDPRSTAFRYPTDTKGNISIPEDHRIDILNFSKVMEGLLNALDGSIDWLDELLNASEF